MEAGPYTQLDSGDACCPAWLVAEEKMALLALRAAVREAMVTAALFPVQNEVIPKVSMMSETSGFTVHYNLKLNLIRTSNQTVFFLGGVPRELGEPARSQAVARL